MNPFKKYRHSPDLIEKYKGLPQPYMKHDPYGDWMNVKHVRKLLLCTLYLALIIGFFLHYTLK